MLLRKVSLLFALSLATLLFTACYFNYNPEKTDVFSTEEITEKLNKRYKSYNAVFSLKKNMPEEIIYFKDSELKYDVESEYLDKIQKRTVYYECSLFPEETIVAECYVEHNGLLNNWLVNLCTDFYSYYFKADIISYYKSVYDKSFSTTAESKFIYDILPAKWLIEQKFKNSKNYIQTKTIPQSFRILVKDEYSTIYEAKISTLEENLKSEKGIVTFYFKFDQNIDLEKVSVSNFQDYFLYEPIYTATNNK